jgi:A/G-specific adenine glycosylase
MKIGPFENVDLTTVRPEHRVLFLSFAASRSVQVVPQLRRAFLAYAKANLRTFPWREPGTSAYRLLLAELLLVQTKAPDVAAIWPTLIERYPTPDRLSRAVFRSLVSFLRPLGLQRQRANALRDLGRHLVRECDGQVPSAVVDLLSLPHVGLYTATAVNCFAYGGRVPIVDANVLRVFGRIFGIPSRIELRRNRKAWATAWAVLPRQRVALHNYGLLDFAAQVCTPTAPKCGACHIRDFCCYGMSRISVPEVNKDKQLSSRL